MAGGMVPVVIGRGGAEPLECGEPSPLLLGGRLGFQFRAVLACGKGCRGICASAMAGTWSTIQSGDGAPATQGLTPHSKGCRVFRNGKGCSAR
jgi:hypothetical protein